MLSDLDMLIEKLEAIMPAAPDPLGLSVVLHDWRPVWNLAKEIQEAFNSGIRYPTKELRQRAWLRFNALRDEASRRANSERAHLRSKSQWLRDCILSDCRGIGYNIIKHCNPPFQSSEEMDEAMIKILNDKISRRDTVYHLGDIVFRSAATPETYLHRLNGKIHLMRGNHDKHMLKHHASRFASVNDRLS